MEHNTQKPYPISPDNRLPRENVPQLRDEGSADVSPQSQRFVGADPTEPRRDEVSERLEAERKERAEIEAGQAAASRFAGCKAANDKSARCLARFDSGATFVQPAEFYQYSDPEIGQYGYF